MRIVINQIPALGRRAGIGHYAHQLLRALRANQRDDQFDGFPTGWVRSAYKTVVRNWPGQNGPAARSAPGATPSKVATCRRWCADQVREARNGLLGRFFRHACARNQYDLYHEPNFIPFASDLPTIATLHDLSVLVHPEWHPASRVSFYEQYFRQGLNACRHFLTDSEFSRREIIRLLGIAPEQVTCTYLGIRPHLRPLRRDEAAPLLHELGLPANYLLYVGTIEPRKNVLTLLRAYTALPSSVRSEWPLVLVGGWGWNSGDVAEYLASEARHQGVRRLGYVPEPHLAALYSGARALLYPSWYEGFGLPPLEMMACGGAVVASSAEALVETVGSQAQLVAPEDELGWRDAILRIVGDDSRWEELRQGSQALASKYTWERCAAQTFQVYQKVGRRPGRHQSGPQRQAA